MFESFEVSWLLPRYSANGEIADIEQYYSTRE